MESKASVPMKSFPGMCVIALLLTGCGTQPPRAPTFGEAYAGPSTLNLRQDIPLQSAVVVTVNHGERLDILQRRRRFVKVRTSRGVEGWTDERLLLTPQQIASLRALSERSRSARSQGLATTYGILNVHTEPDRFSPSFLQVKEGEKVDLIERRVTPRSAAPPPNPAPPPIAAKTSVKKKKKEKKAVEIPPPPMPLAPPLPRDWREISTSAPIPAAAPPEEPKPIPMDDWSLIRNASGQSGWVLSRRLVMAIPDEVAQYAEGRRIVSYFALGETRDGKIVKPSWLWTTVEHSSEPYDFDSFRVFVWSLRHHRYETGHIERNLKGYFPVLTGPVPGPKNSGGERVPGFSIVVEKKDGLRYRRSFAFVGNMVRFSGEERVENPPEPASRPADPTLLASEKPPAAAEVSLYGNLKERIRRLFGR